MDDEREELTRYLRQASGLPPAWYAQLRIAQTLCCAPWEAFPDDTTPRAVWVKRAVDVMHAEADARKHHQRQAEIRARHSRTWDFTRLDAVASQHSDVVMGKVTTTDD